MFIFKEKYGIDQKGFKLSRTKKNPSAGAKTPSPI
jgi:hypothetical protein